MVNILLCGDLQDTSEAEALLPALSLYGGVCSSGTEDTDKHGKPTRYFFYESAEIPQIELKRGILILKNNIFQQHPVEVPKGFICVLEAGSLAPARLLYGSSAAVVLCGTGPRNTLSLSELNSSSALVSLQRSLMPLEGNLVEPCEIEVRLSAERSPQQILLVSAVLLLSGVDPDNGFII